MLPRVTSLERGRAGALEWLSRLVALALCALGSVACSAGPPDDGDSGGKGGTNVGGRAGGAGLGSGGMVTGGTGGLAASIECPVGQSVCGTTCVNLQADPNHCGSCAGVCPVGTACQAGTCQAQCGV